MAANEARVNIAAEHNIVAVFRDSSTLGRNTCSTKPYMANEYIYSTQNTELET